MFLTYRIVWFFLFLKIGHADGFFFFFCLDTKEEETRRKNQGYVSGPTPERPFWCWKKNSLRCTTLKQHFSAPPGHSSAHAPTPRPVFHFLLFLYTPRRFAVGFWVRLRLAFGFAVCYLSVIRYCFLAVSDKYYRHRKNASEVRTKHCDDWFDSLRWSTLSIAMFCSTHRILFSPRQKVSWGLFLRL